MLLKSPSASPHQKGIELASTHSLFGPWEVHVPHHTLDYRIIEVPPITLMLLQMNYSGCNKGQVAKLDKQQWLNNVLSKRPSNWLRQEVASLNFKIHYDEKLHVWTSRYKTKTNIMYKGGPKRSFWFLLLQDLHYIITSIIMPSCQLVVPGSINYIPWLWKRFWSPHALWSKGVSTREILPFPPPNTTPKPIISTR